MVLDGASLLRHSIWLEGSTMANEYATFTIKHYGKAIVVSGDYRNKADTEDCAHHHRNKANLRDLKAATGL